MSEVILGIENIYDNAVLLAKIRGRRIGLVAHPASTSSDFRHSTDVLLDLGAKLEVLFGPEHGFGGESQDMESVVSDPKGLHGLPLRSLYGDSEKDLSPDESDIRGLDVLVFDLFDIGSRYYTFVWTALLCLRVCHKMGVELILTDRPNPLRGDLVEGAPLEREYTSFVGLAPVSNRHGLTPGELVSLVAKQEGIDENLTVVPMRGWRRNMWFSDTSLPWILPSPNMPTFDTALVYPGLCLVEATWASEGRGTTRPFELVGAPGIEGRSLAERLTAMSLPGVAFRAVSFKPGFQKHSGEICGGVQLHVTDKEAFLPYRTGVGVLLALKAEANEEFEWRHDPYEFVTDRPAIDLLAGSPLVREAVEQGASLEDVAATWRDGEREFEHFRRDFFLYDI